MTQHSEASFVKWLEKGKPGLCCVSIQRDVVVRATDSLRRYTVRSRDLRGQTQVFNFRLSLAIQFAVRDAGFVLARFTSRLDVRPYECLMDTPCASAACFLGEFVLGMIPDHDVFAVKAHQQTDKWKLVVPQVTTYGLLQCRSLRRKPGEH